MADAPERKFRMKRVDALSPKVWALLVAMDAKCFDDAAPPLTDNSGAWWVVYRGNTPVAFGAIKQSSWSDKGGYLHRAAVLPAYRGNGLQKLLIRKRLAYAKEQEWEWVVTDTSNNAASGNSLISSGFRMYTPTVPWSFSYACYWKKFIKP